MADFEGQPETMELDDVDTKLGAAEDEDLEDGLGGFDAEVGKEAKLTKDGGVVKKILEKGEGWQTPEQGDEVSVHYTGTLLDGTKFDSSRDRNEPFKFKLGTGSVIKGWDAGVKTMTKGEKAVLTCKPEYAYGAAGSPPTIPGDATLQFEVELLSWRSIKDIAGDGGIIKTIVAEGSGYQTPKDPDEVFVQYKVRVEGSEASVSESPAEGVAFTVSEGHLIQALATAVKTMKKGEKVQLAVKPEYGFGEEGNAELGVPPNAALQVELELLKWNTVEKVAPDGGVTKKTTTEGADWKKPNEGAKVSVRYTARLVDGTVFDKRTEGDELEFVTDEEQVVEGLDLAVRKMKKGEVAEVTLAPQYAFGDAASQQKLAVVPPKSAVTYTVELVDFTNAKESWELKDDERVVEAARKKDAGNAKFKAGNFAAAVKRYKAACELLDNDAKWDADLKRESRDVKKSAWLNRAAVALKLQDTKDAIAACNKVLELDSVNVKGLYRRAQAYLKQGDFTEAQADIKKALLEEPQNRDVRLLQKQLREQSAEATKKEAALYGSIFSKLAKKDLYSEHKAPPKVSIFDRDEAAEGAPDPELNGHSNGAEEAEEIKQSAADTVQQADAVMQEAAEAAA